MRLLPRLLPLVLFVAVTVAGCLPAGSLREKPATVTVTIQPPAPTATIPVPTVTAPPSATVEPAPTLPAAVRCVRHAQTWWLRSGPALDARPLAVLAGGDSVAVLEPGAWARVDVLTGDAAGMEGFVNSNGLEGCAE